MDDRTAIFDIANYPVMPAQCQTCPFRTNDDGRYPDTALVQKIQRQVITEASQICHHADGLW